VIFQSIDLFGVTQAIRYREQLRYRFQLLAENPRLGRLAPRAGKDVRRHEHAAHVIFYRVTENGVLILGVVHARRMRGLRF
jgi:toxin ParE1/3/4